MTHKLLIAITGASGSIYAKHLFVRLAALAAPPELGVIISDNGRAVWEYELKEKVAIKAAHTEYSNNDMFAAPASGSAGFDSMIIIPCSMGTLGRISSGVADNLIARAADVMLKERRKLILAIREAPYNLIHLKNMQTITEAGGIIMPASPWFYNHPKTIEDIADELANRLLVMADIDTLMKQWG